VSTPDANPSDIPESGEVAPTRRRKPTRLAPHSPDVEHLVAAGWQPLPQYLSLFAHLSTPERRIVERTAKWRQLNDVAGQLVLSEAGRADAQEILTLAGSLAGRADELEARAAFRRSYGLLPSRFGVVELERLIIHQREVDLEHAARIDQALGRDPSEREILDLCLPLSSSHPATRARALGPTAWALTSDSNDLRPLELVVFDSSAVSGYDAPGDLERLIGFSVGYSPNLLNVIEVNGRLILNNGHHRAFALLRRGRRHAPCLVQSPTRQDDFALLAPDIQQQMQLYIGSPRPPLLIDFFNDAVCETVRLPRCRREVRVSMSVEAVDVPA
jgi:hypothetical protein